MVVLKVESEWGYSPDPSNHSVVSNLSGWQILEDFHNGDKSGLAKTFHVYPRFMPSPAVIRPLGQEVLKKLGFEPMGIMMYLSPDIWAFTRRHVANEHRGPFKMNPDDLIFKCVDVAGHRLYCVIYDIQRSPSLMGTWTKTGGGISVREAELFLAQIDSLVEVPVPDYNNPPAPTWTPVEPVHQELRERVNELVHHGAADPAKVTSQPGDVFLYPSGMNAMYRASEMIFKYRPGYAVLFGVPYHTTYEFLKEEYQGSYKHFGMVDEKGTDELEAWVEKEAREGKPVSFLLTEAPCNPTLASPDQARLKRLSEKYGFLIITDDTVGGFGNIDVFPFCDVLYTSLTKTFSGKADCIGGSIVLNPQSPHYGPLSASFAQHYRNQLFAADAKVLLSNSREYFPRMQKFNRNAQVMAEFLHKQAQDPASPVTKVRYPSLLPDRRHYDAVMRRSTPEMPQPGYGCLLLVEFEDEAMARAFYDRCGFLTAPHLGAPMTLVFAANFFLFAMTKQEQAYFEQYDVLSTGIRLSAGLEDEEDLIDTLQDAIDAAAEVKKNGGKA